MNKYALLIMIFLSSIYVNAETCLDPSVSGVVSEGMYERCYKAATSGEQTAQLNLGLMYANGHGVK